MYCGDVLKPLAQDTQGLGHDVLKLVAKSSLQLRRHHLGGTIILTEENLPDDLIDFGPCFSMTSSADIVRNFQTSSTTHDGAVLISPSNGWTGCMIMKLDDSESGTRHRSASWLAKHSTSTVVVISEETQKISIYKRDYKYEIDSDKTDDSALLAMFVILIITCSSLFCYKTNAAQVYRFSLGCSKVMAWCSKVVSDIEKCEQSPTDYYLDEKDKIPEDIDRLERLLKEIGAFGHIQEALEKVKEILKVQITNNRQFYDYMHSGNWGAKGAERRHQRKARKKEIAIHSGRTRKTIDLLNACRSRVEKKQRLRIKTYFMKTIWNRPLLLGCAMSLTPGYFICKRLRYHCALHKYVWSNHQ